MENDSPVIAFMRMVWRETRGGSWQLLNEALYGALRLAVEGGFKFHVDDFKTIAKEFRPGYWMGESLGEYFYTMACLPRRGRENRSAAIVFEAWKNRPPFTFFGQRLAETSTFFWWETIPEEAKLPENRASIVEHGYGALKVEVSSFSGDGSYLNAIWFKEPRHKREPGKGPDRRFRITIKDLKTVQRALTVTKAKKPVEDQA